MVLGIWGLTMPCYLRSTHLDVWEQSIPASFLRSVTWSAGSDRDDVLGPSLGGQGFPQQSPHPRIVSDVSSKAKQKLQPEHDCLRVRNYIRKEMSKSFTSLSLSAKQTRGIVGSDGRNSKDLGVTCVWEFEFRHHLFLARDLAHITYSLEPQFHHL